jgi:hypothetical protein
MSGALARLDTSPRATARRALIALIAAAAVELGIVAVANAADWPPGAFYTVSALALVIVGAIAVPIIEPPRPPATDAFPVLPDTEEPGDVRTSRPATRMVQIDDIPVFEARSALEEVRLRIADLEVQLSGQRDPTLPVPSYDPGLGDEWKAKAEWTSYGAVRRYIARLNVALASMQREQREQLTEAEFARLLDLVAAYETLSESGESHPEGDSPSWADLQASWMWLERRPWAVADIAAVLDTTAADVQELRASVFRRLREQSERTRPSFRSPPAV